MRKLIKFLDRQEGQEQVYTDFEDEIDSGPNEFELVTVSGDLVDYRIKVERFIREHENHPAIQHLKNNQPISITDINALESLLFGNNGLGKKDIFMDTYGTEQPLGILIRQIIGLVETQPKKRLQTLNNSLRAIDCNYLDSFMPQPFWRKNRPQAIHWSRSTTLPLPSWH